MARKQDPTEPIRKRAAAFPEASSGTSCNQTSFKTGKVAFLYTGPGPKGQGFKAMFKLVRSLEQARKLAAQDPDRFGVGSTRWVTARFSAEKPLPKSIWEKWLKESYDLSCGAKGPTAKKAAKKKTPRKR